MHARRQNNLMLFNDCTIPFSFQRLAGDTRIASDLRVAIFCFGLLRLFIPRLYTSSQV